MGVIFFLANLLTPVKTIKVTFNQSIEYKREEKLALNENMQHTRSRIVFLVLIAFPQL